MIMVAPNGARRTKQDHPNLPMTNQELAREALACSKAGASAVHIHVRDDQGKHVLDAHRYANAIEEITASVGDAIICQITTEAVGIYNAAQQMDCVRQVVPTAVSVALKEIIPDDDNTEPAREFFDWMKDQNIAPQFILYDEEDVGRFFRLQALGVIPFSQPFLLFVLGRYARDQQSSPQDLDPFLAALANHKAHWAMCAFGKQEADCALYAAQKGGHVRIGFENNLHMPDGQLAPSNSALVTSTKEKLTQSGIEVMDVESARALLKLSLR